MAESWGRGANITTAREQSTGLDTALREEPAPGVVSSKSPVADSALVGRTGGGSRLTDNTLAASAAAERAIEARGVRKRPPLGLTLTALPLQLPNLPPR